MPDWGLWILRDANANGPADHVVTCRIDGAKPLTGDFSDEP